MLVAVVPPPLNNLARVRLVLLDSRVRDHADVVVHVKAEQRTRLSSGFGYDELVEGVVLRGAMASASGGRIGSCSQDAHAE